MSNHIINHKYLIVIIGPTAIGKTSVGIEIAQHYNSEILSCDSRQFYKEMRIGTAVPSDDELRQVKHNFIQNISIQTHYSVGDFERDALEFIDDYFKDKDILVMVGGSGLYEKAVTEGLDDFPEVPSHYREQLKKEAELYGIERLQNELKEKDISYYNIVDKNNVQRLIRALEIIRFTGNTFTSYRIKNSKKRNFNVIKIGLKSDREIIYDNINKRVDLMMEMGLLDEVKALEPFRELNALQTVGYRELFSYLDGEISLDHAVSEIKKNTRRFAKRQMTWYRKDNHITWFLPSEKDKILSYLENYLNNAVYR